MPSTYLGLRLPKSNYVGIVVDLVQLSSCGNSWTGVVIVNDLDFLPIRTMGVRSTLPLCL